jgi:hypothetical protein
MFSVGDIIEWADKKAGDTGLYQILGDSCSDLYNTDNYWIIKDIETNNTFRYSTLEKFRLYKNDLNFKFENYYNENI